MAKKARKKSTKRTPPQRRATRFDRIANEAVQNYGHLASTDIRRRRDVLTAEVEAVDAELIELAARTAEARSKRAKTEASLAGILHVLQGRC